MDSSDRARRAVTAFFDERSQAQAAVDDLLAAGVDRGRITLLEGGPGLKPDAVEPSSEKGFLAAVRELFMADEDHHAYGEGLRRGGFLLSVETAGHDARVVEILDREGAVDMDARQSDWELEGWDPARASRDLSASADLRAASEAEVRAAVEPVGAVGPAFARGAAPSAPAVDPRTLSEGEVRGAVEPVGAVGPAFSRAGAPPAAAPPAAADVRAAVEPVGAVGPAFGAGRSPAPDAGRRAAVRDAEAEGLRLRTYVEGATGPARPR